MTPSAPLAQHRARGARLAALLTGGAVLLYSSGFLLWYSATPLGLYPVLDGREMLALAHAMASGTLPHEPFYRAPLYPALLAGLLGLGLPEHALPLAARTFNGLLHLASTALVWHCARRLWPRTAAAVLAAVLFGLDPVVLHFAADPLDITLAITLLLGAVSAALAALGVRGDGADAQALSASALAASLFTLAALTRPQLLACLPAWWLTSAVCTRHSARRRPRLVAAVLPALLLLFAMGGINHALSGEFRILPWQGAFDVWAANHAGANGRYFEQQARLARYVEGRNPARAEAERRYRAARPEAVVTIDAMTRYWRERTLGDIAAAPLAWGGLLARKAWYLLNDFEQYNNKTYSVHKARSPWLAPNPLGWSVLLMAGVLGAAALRAPAAATLFGALFAACVMALLLTYVSARFRLPLVPLLAILAGGITQWPALAPRRRWYGLAAAIVLGGASLLPLSRAERERTFVQDDLLLARAALQSGDTVAARAHAASALARVPGHRAALEIDCVARFNAWLRGTQDDAGMKPIIGACSASADDSPVARRLLGILAWRGGDDAAARAWLQPLAAVSGPEHDAALAALLMAGLVTRAGVTWDPDTAADVLQLAMALHGDAAARARLQARYAPAELARQLAALARTFTRPGPGG